MRLRNPFVLLIDFRGYWRTKGYFKNKLRRRLFVINKAISWRSISSITEHASVVCRRVVVLGAFLFMVLSPTTMHFSAHERKCHSRALSCMLYRCRQNTNSFRSGYHYADKSNCLDIGVTLTLSIGQRWSSGREYVASAVTSLTTRPTTRWRLWRLPVLGRGGVLFTFAGWDNWGVNYVRLKVQLVTKHRRHVSVSLHTAITENHNN